MTENRKAALNDAVKALAMRLMTRKQLMRKLAEKGYGEDDTLFAADRMEELGALNDREYAFQFVRDKSARGFGAMRIRQELRTRGIDPDLIDEALEETDDSSEAIERFILSKMKGETMTRLEAKKISDALARKGFTWEEISPILHQYLEEN